VVLLDAIHNHNVGLDFLVRAVECGAAVARQPPSDFDVLTHGELCCHHCPLAPILGAEDFQEFR
jgi:hypothetical protein